MVYLKIDISYYIVLKRRWFAHHFIFMFLLYNIINRCQSGLGYYLLTKTYFWEEIYINVDTLIIIELNEVVEKIKATEKYTNPTILKSKHQV